MQTMQPDLPFICLGSEKKTRVTDDGDKDDGF
jgi:hypothetical protein